MTISEDNKGRTSTTVQSTFISEEQEEAGPSTTSSSSSTAVYHDLLSFLQSPNDRLDLRYEATKAIMQIVNDRHDSLALIQHGVLPPLLKIVSMGGSTLGSSSSEASKAIDMIIETSLLALKIVLIWTSSSIQEIQTIVNEQLLSTSTNNAISRLVEDILNIPLSKTFMTAGHNNEEGEDDINNNADKYNGSNKSKQAKQYINTALAILVNLSRTEQGAIELVGSTLPDQAVYRDTERLFDKDVDVIDEHTRIKPTLELLLDRFIKTTPIIANSNDSPNSLPTIEDMKIIEPLEWEQLWTIHDPYQHFSALLMNITQVQVGRQFIMRIPKTSGSSNNTAKEQPQSVLQRLISTQIHGNNNNNSATSSYSSTSTSTTSSTYNPIRRRGIYGLIRNCCLETDSAWWLLNICKIITPVLLPLAGPEELDVDEKRGLDTDLWINGPEQQRDIDEMTRLYCVEAILLLCATGRTNRNALRIAKTYIILKYCDMVEESELVSDRINDCVQYLRRDEEGTIEGSSDQLIDTANTTSSATASSTSNNKAVGLLLEASSSNQINAAVVQADDDEHGHDYDNVD